MAVCFRSVSPMYFVLYRELSRRRMKMTPLVLLLLGLSGVCGDSHTLRYYRTAVSSPGSGLPQFSSVGYVDDREIVNYNSDSRQYLPKTEWMKKLEPDYWERNTLINEQNELTYEHNVLTAMNRFNQTGGFHCYQIMFGCELRDDGSIAEYIQYGYDGRDFMYLDTQRGIWIPTMKEAQISTQRWNSPDMRTGEIAKHYLQKKCVEWLKIHIANGRDDLERRVRPMVKVWGRPRSDGITRLQCLVYGFHPRPVDVTWVRNVKDQLLLDEMSPILPHPDGTYQIRVSVEVLPREGDTYSCHVDHSSLGNETLGVKWEPNKCPPFGILFGTAIGCLVAVIAVFAVAVIGTNLIKVYFSKHLFKNPKNHEFTTKPFSVI